MSDEQRRTITIAGDFKKSVNVTNSLTNGESCSAGNFSHAEGFESYAEGKYSFAGGYHAHAKDNQSFVWSGKDEVGYQDSNGKGTFNVYVNSSSNSGLDGIYVNGNTMTDCISSKFSSIYENSRLFNSDITWSGGMTFTGAVGVRSHGITLSQSAVLNVGSENDGSCDVNLYGNSTAKTIQFKTSGETGLGSQSNIATTQYVNNALKSSLGDVLTSYVKKPNGSDFPIGSGMRPIYADENGNLQTVLKDVVFRDETDVGNDLNPVFLKDGGIKRSSVNLGGNDRHVYIKDGSMTASSLTLGDGNKIILYENGTVKESSLTIGGYKSEGGLETFTPVYLSSGRIVTTGNGHNVGGAATPIYIKDGKFRPCDGNIGGGGGNVNAVTNFIVDTAIRNVVPNCFVTNAFSSVANISGGRTVMLYGSLAQPRMETLSDYTQFKSSIGKQFQRRFWPSLAKSGGNGIASIGFENNSNPSTWDNEGANGSSIKLICYNDTFLKGVSNVQVNGNVISSLRVDSGQIVPTYLNAVMGVNSSVSDGQAGGKLLKTIKTENGLIKCETSPALTSISENSTESKFVNTVKVDKTTGAVTLGFKTVGEGVSKIETKTYETTVNCSNCSFSKGGTKAEDFTFSIDSGYTLVSVGCSNLEGPRVLVCLGAYVTGTNKATALFKALDDFSGKSTSATLKGLAIKLS